MMTSMFLLLLISMEEKCCWSCRFNFNMYKKVCALFDACCLHHSVKCGLLWENFLSVKVWKVGWHGPLPPTCFLINNCFFSHFWWDFEFRKCFSRPKVVSPKKIMSLSSLDSKNSILKVSRLEKPFWNNNVHIYKLKKKWRFYICHFIWGQKPGWNWRNPTC